MRAQNSALRAGSLHWAIWPNSWAAAIFFTPVSQASRSDSAWRVLISACWASACFFMASPFFFISSTSQSPPSFLPRIFMFMAPCADVILV